MTYLGEHCSMTERRADDATRDVADALKCEYMQDHIGDIMLGTIAAVTNFGFFVRLNDIHIDGLVHVTSLLSDYYIFDAGKQTLKGERTGRIYRIGDVLEVKVLSVNLDDKKIDFELADQALAGQRSHARKPASKKTDRPIDKRARNKAAANNDKKPHKKSDQPIIRELDKETEKKKPKSPKVGKSKTKAPKVDKSQTEKGTMPEKKAKKKFPVKQGVKNTLSSKKRKTSGNKPRTGTGKIR